MFKFALLFIRLPLLGIKWTWVQLTHQLVLLINGFWQGPLIGCTSEDKVGKIVQGSKIQMGGGGITTVIVLIYNKAVSSILIFLCLFIFRKGVNINSFL